MLFLSGRNTVHMRNLKATGPAGGSSPESSCHTWCLLTRPQPGFAADIPWRSTFLSISEVLLSLSTVYNTVMNTASRQKGSAPDPRRPGPLPRPHHWSLGTRENSVFLGRSWDAPVRLHPFLPAARSGRSHSTAQFPCQQPIAARTWGPLTHSARLPDPARDFSKLIPQTRVPRCGVTLCAGSLQGSWSVTWLSINHAEKQTHGRWV